MAYGSCDGSWLMAHGSCIERDDRQAHRVANEPVDGSRGCGDASLVSHARRERSDLGLRLHPQLPPPRLRDLVSGGRQDFAVQTSQPREQRRARIAARMFRTSAYEVELPDGCVDAFIELTRPASAAQRREPRNYAIQMRGQAVTLCDGVLYI